MVLGPVLVGISQRNEETVAFKVGGQHYILVVKRPVMGGQREMEVFTIADALAGGPFYFNIHPRRIEVLQFDPAMVSGFLISGSNFRMYSNPSAASGPRRIRRNEFDVVTTLPTSGVTVEAFEGIDPFVIDVRSLALPNRLYLIYATVATFVIGFRDSTDLGVVWTAERQFDQTVPPVRRVEANITDPLGDREHIQVLHQRDD